MTEDSRVPQEEKVNLVKHLLRDKKVNPECQEFVELQDLLEEMVLMVKKEKLVDLDLLVMDYPDLRENLEYLVSMDYLGLKDKKVLV